MARFLILIFVMCAQASSALVYERFEQDGKVGIRDEQGNVVLPASFDALGWSDGSFSLLGQITGYRQAGRWGLVNLKKEYVTKAEFTSLTAGGGNYVRASREVSAITTKTGCINLEGDVVIPFSYDDIVLHDLRAIVMIKERTRYLYGLLDLSNKTILPAIYQSITPLGTLRFAVRDFSGKTALCTENGKWITGFDIDSLSAFHGDVAILYKGSYRGVIDRMGVVRAEALYREVVLDPGAIRARRPDAWKILDVHQRELHRTEADAIMPLAANRYRRNLSGKSGLVDSLFNEIIPAVYDFIGPVEEEKFIVGIGGKYGLMRTNGSLILPIAFDTLIRDGHLLRARSFEEGRPGWHLYDTVGVRKTSRRYDRINAPQEGLYPVLHQGFAGAVDRVGHERIACVYDSLLSFSGDRVVVKFKGLYGIITRDDVWQLAPQPKPIQLVGDNLYLFKTGSLSLVKDYAGNIIYFTDNPVQIKSDHFLERLPDGSEKEVNFNGQLVRYRIVEPGFSDLPTSSEEHEGLTVVRRDGKYGFVDERGRLRIANRYEEAGNFREGLAPVRILGKWGFIDKADQVVIHPAYDRPSAFQNGMAVVVRSGRWGLIDRDGHTRLDLRYDSIRQMDTHSFLIFQGGQCGLADGTGQVLLEPRFESIEPAGDHGVIVRQAGRYGLLTRDGLSVFPIKYQVLRFNLPTRTFFASEPAEWESVPMAK
ncbi:MAG: WG repeat-containing protein [Cyclobacteriaceae bacterium]|nr:WG repeat-containing protein [Cyclobacteriaceae bacterium]